MVNLCQQVSYTDIVLNNVLNNVSNAVNQCEAWGWGCDDAALCVFFKCAFFHCLCCLEPLSPSVFTYPVFACVAHSVVFIHSDKRRACKMEIKCKTTHHFSSSACKLCLNTCVSQDISASKFPVTYNDINVYTNLSTNST